MTMTDDEVRISLNHQQKCGLRVCNRRQELGLSQLTVARAAKTTQQTLSRVEAGEQVPSDGLKVRIARALGCKAMDLFPYSDEDEGDWGDE